MRRARAYRDWCSPERGDRRSQACGAGGRDCRRARGRAAWWPRPRRSDMGETRAAGGEELLEQRDGRGVESFQAGRQHKARIGALADAQPGAVIRAELAQDLLGAEVVFDLLRLERVDELLETVADLIQARIRRGPRGVHPGRGGRLEDQRVVARLAGGERQREAREVVREHVVLAPPGIVLAEGLREIVLAAAGERRVAEVLVHEVY